MLIHQFLEWARSNATNHSNAIIAIAAVLNLLASLLLWRANRKSANFTRLIYSTQFKPNFAVDVAKFEITIHSVNIDFVIFNAGQGEGIITHFTIRSTIGGEEVDMVSSNASLTIVGGGGLPVPVVAKAGKHLHLLYETDKPFECAVEIEYKGMAKDYYRYEEKRSYKGPRGMLDNPELRLITNRTVKHNAFKLRYHKVREGFRKPFATASRK